jgi:hypothetical protein
MHREINTQIEKLWMEYENDEGTELAPLFYNVFKCKGLLFVGCNPSFPEGSLANRLRQRFSEVHELRNFFNWKNVLNNRAIIDELLKIEADVRGSNDQKHYRYFTPLIDMAKDAGFEDQWEHVDVFVSRLTSQGEFKKKIEIKGKLNEFGQKQLEIFKSVLSAVDPKIIVVSNAYISELLKRKECFGDKLEPDNDHGWHNLSLEKNNPTPIFFSSMISGQRALDVDSRRRLTWHIKKAHEYLNAKGN